MIFFSIVLGLVGIGLMVQYNRLVGGRNRAKEALSSVEVMLKKRFDLLPNLVASVSQYAKHEKTLFSEVTLARSQMMSGGLKPAELDRKTSSLFGRLFAVAESYPNLKANENFLHLQKTLHEVEEQLSAARRTYNAHATEFNNSVHAFPSNLVAGFFRFTEIPFFESSPQERENPDVRKLFG